MKSRLPYSIFLTMFFMAAFLCKAEAQYDFSLKNTDGKTVALKDFSEARGFIVVFTCNHCPFAKLYPKRLNQLNKKFKPLGVPLIAISSTDTVMYEEDVFEKMVSKARSEKFNFPYLYDSTQAVARNYHAERTPQAFVIWKENGVFVLKYNGAIDDNGAEPRLVKESYVQQAVDELLRGAEVTNPFTHSIGCKINYRPAGY